MARYAESTSVSTEKTRMEIERTLQRYGATSFAYGTDIGVAQIAFRIGERHIRFLLRLPELSEKRFTHHSRGRRTAEAQHAQWEQACRQSWRALALVIKAKLEAVAAGITTIEDEFLAHTVLPDGSTFGKWAKPQIDEAYRVGGMPTMLALAHEDGDQ